MVFLLFWRRSTIDRDLSPQHTMKQTGSAINTRNTWRIILKWGSFNNKQHTYIVSKLLRLAFIVTSLLEQHNTPLLSLHLEVGVIVSFGRRVRVHQEQP